MMISHDDSARRRALAFLGLAMAGVLLTFYLASYFFLMKLQSPAYPPLSATPMTVVNYYLQYGHEPYAQKWLLICLVGGALPSFAGMAALLRPVQRSLHGDARFATTREIAVAGMFAKSGLILGRVGSRFIMLGKQMGALCAAPPRSGKGAGLVQPNALSWAGSFVVNDVRKECWRITSGWRATFSQVFLLDPLAEDGRTSGWNPMSYVRDDPALRINDLQKLANMLSPDPATGDPFWPAACRDLFIGFGLYVMETPGLARTMGEVLRQAMFGGAESPGDHWKAIITQREKDGKPLSEACKALLYDFASLAPNTQSSVRKTYTAKLQLWGNPLVDAATSFDSFDLRQLRRERISIYVGVNPGDMDRLSLLLNLFFTQLLDLNMDKMPEDDPSVKYEMLVMMDEFTALGRMPIFSSAISAMGGYGIRPFVIIQAFAQLRATYGAELAEVIATCCGGLVVYAPREQKYAEDISKMLGNFTAKAKSKSHQIMSGKFGSVNESAAARPLLNPNEVKQIGKDNEIIFVEGMLPIFCKKIWYWKLGAFSKRTNLEIPYIAPIPNSMSPTKTGIAQAITAVPEGPRIITPAPIARSITAADIPTLKKRSLTDYAVNFEKVELPKGEPLTDDDVRKAFGSFLKTIEESSRET